MKDKRFIFMLDCVNVALIVLMACIIAMFVVLPFIQEMIQSYFVYVAPTMVFFYTGGALLFWFFAKLRAMIQTVKKDAAFVPVNVLRLKNASWALLLLACDFGFILYFLPSFSVILCIIILALGFCSARVLSVLIEKAIAYKEDSDLTV